MFKVNNKFIANFEDVSHLCSNVSIVNFEHVIAGWVCRLCKENTESVTRILSTCANLAKNQCRKRHGKVAKENLLVFLKGVQL